MYFLFMVCVLQHAVDFNLTGFLPLLFTVMIQFTEDGLVYSKEGRDGITSHSRVHTYASTKVQRKSSQISSKISGLGKKWKR